MGQLPLHAVHQRLERPRRPDRNPYALDRNRAARAPARAPRRRRTCARWPSARRRTARSSVRRMPAAGRHQATVGLVSRAGIIRSPPPGHAGDGAHGGRRRSTARRPGRRRRTGSGDRRQPGHGQADYTTFLDRDALKGARLGVVRKMFGDNPHVIRELEAALARCSVSARNSSTRSRCRRRHVRRGRYTVLLYEFKAGLNAYFATRGLTRRLKTLADLLPSTNRTTSGRCLSSARRSSSWRRPRAALFQRIPGSAAALRRLSTVEGIDAVWTCTASTRWSLRRAARRSRSISSMATTTRSRQFDVRAVSGYPHVTVPAGQVFAYPSGCRPAAGRGANPASSRSPTRSSRPRNIGARRPSAPAQTCRPPETTRRESAARRAGSARMPPPLAGTPMIRAACPGSLTTTPRNNVLSTTNLAIQFDAKPLFEHVSVKFSDGNRYGLIGANGSGKSTLMKILAASSSPAPAKSCCRPGCAWAS